MMKTAIACAALLGAALWANYTKTGADEVSVKRSPTAPWIEVYHDGELSAEWQPSDGAIYQVLEKLLDDELWPVSPTPTEKDRLKVAIESITNFWPDFGLLCRHIDATQNFILCAVMEGFHCFKHSQNAINKGFLKNRRLETDVQL